MTRRKTDPGAIDVGAMTPANDHGRCPICGDPGTASYRPFCSKRCADVDLARWLGGNYVIAGRGADEDEDGDDAHAAAQASATGNARSGPDADA
jgi:hypothetical protein